MKPPWSGKRVNRAVRIFAWYFVLCSILGLYGPISGNAYAEINDPLSFIFLAYIVVLSLSVAWTGYVPKTWLPGYSVIRRVIYHSFNPDAKEAFRIRKEKEAEERIKQEEKEAQEKVRQEEKEAEEKVRQEEKKAAEKEQKEAEQRRVEFEHIRHRDGDRQYKPYTYKIGRHGNEALAIRYGIANLKTNIQLQKIRKVSKDLYEVLLTEHRDRKAKAIIEVGTEHVKTFYPIDDEWFEKYSDIEQTLKGNGTFTLKELATFHVQKIVSYSSQ